MKWGEEVLGRLVGGNRSRGQEGSRRSRQWGTQKTGVDTQDVGKQREGIRVIKGMTETLDNEVGQQGDQLRSLS